jgi:xanthine dehydrogenase accessory factor
MTARSPDCRHVLEASLAALAHEKTAALAVVVRTEGSTYVGAGAMALFGPRTAQAGWLSGGCLEPEIEARASAAAQAGECGWMDIDTRDDEDLLSGSAVGCRGRLHLALLPLSRLDGWPDLVDAWRHGREPLRLTFTTFDTLQAECGSQRANWRLHARKMPPEWAGPCELLIAPPPRIVVFGGGPESDGLLPLLRRLGWIVTLIERRERWRAASALADHALDATPTTAAAIAGTAASDAALVMHHNFELDRETLLALSATEIPFIGLLGPVRRREDLFRVLPGAARDALLPRLHSPAGLNLGGSGPEAIALSIAAQLQAWRSGEEGSPGVAG